MNEQIKFPKYDYILNRIERANDRGYQDQNSNALTLVEALVAIANEFATLNEKLEQITDNGFLQVDPGDFIGAAR